MAGGCQFDDREYNTKVGYLFAGNPGPCQLSGLLTLAAWLNELNSVNRLCTGFHVVKHAEFCRVTLSLHQETLEDIKGNEVICVFVLILVEEVFVGFEIHVKYFIVVWGVESLLCSALCVFYFDVSEADLLT